MLNFQKLAVAPNLINFVRAALNIIERMRGELSCVTGKKIRSQIDGLWDELQDIRKMEVPDGGEA